MCFNVGELQKKKINRQRPSADFAVPTVLASNRRSLTRPHVSPPAPAIQQNQLPKYRPRYSHQPRYPHPCAMCLAPSSTTHHPTTARRHSLADPRMRVPSPFLAFAVFNQPPSPQRQKVVAVTTAMTDAARLTGVSFPAAIFSTFFAFASTARFFFLIRWPALFGKPQRSDPEPGLIISFAQALLIKRPPSRAS